MHLVSRPDINDDAGRETSRMRKKVPSTVLTAMPLQPTGNSDPKPRVYVGPNPYSAERTGTADSLGYVKASPEYGTPTRYTHQNYGIGTDRVTSCCTVRSFVVESAHSVCALYNEGERDHDESPTVSYPVLEAWVCR